MTAAAAPEPRDEARLPVIDGVRGLAIFVIMQYHFWGLSFAFFDKSNASRLDRAASEVRHFGWVSVDLFLVLSGFLITGILLEAKSGRHRYFTNFYGRRFLRIFPLYYAFVLFVLLVMPHTGWMSEVAATDQFTQDQGWFWTYLVNVAASTPDLGAQIPLVHAHIWTLSLEEQYYIIWPLVVLLLNRRLLMVLCLAAPALAFIFRLAVVEGAFDTLFYQNAAQVLLPARFDCLALGSFVALAAMEPGGLGRLARWAPYAALSAVGVLLVVFLSQGGIEVLDDATLTFGFSAGAILAVSVLVLALTSSPRMVINRFFAHPVMRAFGTYSYCMYIIHLLVGFELSAWFIREDLVRTVGGQHLPFNLAFNAAATTICFTIAFASWHLYEKQWLRLKVLFPRTRPRVLEPSVEPAIAAARSAPS